MSFWLEIEDPKERGPFSHINTETTFLCINGRTVDSPDLGGEYPITADCDLGHDSINWSGGLGVECALTAGD